ncbi:MAG: (2Fe-2S) ferredoxin domain-containing protein [Kiritimatiellae bacterium]|nr:(2Fe-2S) ferredoxin domain-containing protein [Kiritimatiellia bacterium]
MSRPSITLCMGSSCFARGNEKNLALCEKFLDERGLQDEVDLVLGACLCKGRCSEGPVVVIDDKVHTSVDEGVMSDLLENLFPKK